MDLLLLIVRFVLLAAAVAGLYVVPGVLWLRRADLSRVERLTLGVGISVAISSALLTLIGTTVGLGVAFVWVLIAVMVALAVYAPAPPDLFRRAIRDSRPLEVSVAVVFGIFVLAALTPTVYRLYDANAIWAPLARSIGDQGNLSPEWIRTLTSGFPPSVALIAGAPARAAGGFSQTLSFLVHPAFATLALVGSVLVAASLGARRSWALAFGIFLASPLVARGVFFHDDLVASALATIGIYAAFRARNWPGWVLAGVLVGGAFGVKHLGIVGLGVVLVVFVTRRGSVRELVGLGLGFLAGLPWYLSNVVRFGNPVFPFLGGVFGTTPDIEFLVKDNASVLAINARAEVGGIGVLAIVLLALGLGSALVAVAWTRRWRTLALFVGLILYALLFFVVWKRSNYATRHVLIMYPTLVGMATAGYAALARLLSVHRSRNPRRTVRIVARVVASGVAALVAVFTVVAIARDVGPQLRPAIETQTGPYSIAAGKLNTIQNRLQGSGTDLERTNGPVASVWAFLREEDPDVLVFSFDNRTYYYPQTTLAAVDLRARSVYMADTAVGRYEAMRELGIGFVFAKPADARHEAVFVLGPWVDLDSRPDLYRLELDTKAGTLYRLVGP